MVGGGGGARGEEGVHTVICYCGQIFDSLQCLQYCCHLCYYLPSVALSCLQYFDIICVTVYLRVFVLFFCCCFFEVLLSSLVDET